MRFVLWLDVCVLCAAVYSSKSRQTCTRSQVKSINERTTRLPANARCDAVTMRSWDENIEIMKSTESSPTSVLIYSHAIFRQYFCFTEANITRTRTVAAEFLIMQDQKGWFAEKRTIRWRECKCVEYELKCGKKMNTCKCTTVGPYLCSDGLSVNIKSATCRKKCVDGRD